MKKYEENDKNSYKETINNYQNARNLMKTMNYSSAKIILENSLKNKENTMDKAIKNDIYVSLGFCYFHLHKYVDSQLYFVMSLEICDIYVNDFNTEKYLYLK